MNDITQQAENSHMVITQQAEHRQMLLLTDLHCQLGWRKENFSDLIDIKEPKCQKRKYNPESTIISGPGLPEFKKRKINPEPAEELTSSLGDIDLSEFDLDMYLP